MTVLNQVRQALKTPFLNPSGVEERVARVYVMTPFEVSQAAMLSIQGELEERAGQVVFTCGASLLSLFELHYAEYLLLKSGLLTSYVSSLRDLFEDSGALHHLSFKHGMLGAARRSTTRAYEKPDFFVTLQRLVDMQLSIPNIKRVNEGVTANQLDEISAAVRVLGIFADVCSDETCTSLLHLSSSSPQRSDFDEIAELLRHEWEAAFEEHARRHGKALASQHHERQLVRLTLRRGPLLRQRMVAEWKRIQTMLDEIVGQANAAFDKLANADGLTAMRHPSYLSYCVCAELHRGAPLLIAGTGPLMTLPLPESLLDDFGRSMMISGPPGYGKTLFCKWSALYDGERFAKRESNVLPIYVALHRFSSTLPSSFEEAFLNRESIPDLIRNHVKAESHMRIRLYLDGLDEIPFEQQRNVLILAQRGAEKYPNLQIIVTCRDHVIGPWVSWLPRVRIAKLSEPKTRNLIEQLLDRELARIAEFYRQLEAVPTLKPLLNIPLLCTLTTSVFTGAVTLPESRTELYRIFVDLLCGGWDIAKGVKRRSEFSSVMKIMFLVRLAFELHSRTTRLASPSGVRDAIKSLQSVHLSRWEALAGDIVQDGLLTRDGERYASFISGISGRALSSRPWY